MQLPFPTKLTARQAQVAVQCMLDVAKVDGLRPEEEQLLRAFHESEPGLRDVRFDAVLGAHSTLSPMEVGQELRMRGVGDAVILLCLMVGHCDGHLSQGERDCIEIFAGLAGMTGQRLAELETMVKDALLAQLAHLADPASVVAVTQAL